MGFQVFRWLTRKKDSVNGRHVLITGGSEGIGLEIARICIDKGAKVSLVARTEAKLLKAKADLKQVSPTASVETFSADVGKRSAVGKAVKDAELVNGPIDFCIASAGNSIPKYFEDLEDDDFERMLRVNYLGVVNLAKEVLPGMVKRDSGHFCAISSMAASVPFVGYAAYAPAKAACKSLVDVLRNEFSDTRIQFHIAFPPDTDTPGLAVENETKPYETSHIWPDFANEVFTPKQVAADLVSDLLAGHYFLRSPDTFANLLIDKSYGYHPRSRPFLEAALAPLFSCLEFVMVGMADRAVKSRAHHKKIDAD